MYYLCSENKGTDQLIYAFRFRICKYRVSHGVAHLKAANNKDAELCLSSLLLA